MDHASPLLQAFVFLTAAVISVPIAKRLGFGSVLGYLIAGAVIGPFGLKLFGTPEDMMHVAEFGVVIMLFLIGLELKPALLWRLRGAILGLGTAQVALTGAALAALFGVLLGQGWQAALAIGLILALSSTAIVMQTLRERGIAQTEPGRAAFGVLLFQDLAIIPMFALFPLLAGGPPVRTSLAAELLPAAPPWVDGVLVVAAMLVILITGRYLLRPLFRLIAATGSREIFTATALLLVVGVALLMQTVGLSPALGAFVAGVVLADSEYRHEIEGDIEPFRGLLLGLFFISVGASLDFALLTREPLLLATLVAALVAVKALILFPLARLGRLRAGEAAIVALGLAQGGEFAFVLFAFIAEAGVITPELGNLLVAVVALSMALTPVLFMGALRLAEGLMRAPQARTDQGVIEADRPDVVIAGFGRFGQAVGRLLIANGYRTSVLEHDADQIDLMRGFGYKANYGDASRIDLLRAAGAPEARLLVIAVDDKEKALQIAEEARRHFPHLKILARAYDRRHAYELIRRKVDAFERETFEAGVQLGVSALSLLGMRRHQAVRAGRLFRRHDERLLQDVAAYWGEDNYRLRVRERTGMVEELMRRDLATFGDGLSDAAWDTDSLDREIAEIEGRTDKREA